VKVSFVTTNKHKFREVSHILKDYPVELEHLEQEYEENHDSSLEEIARSAALRLSRELAINIVLEDTGLFFAAYDNFPRALPKFVFNSLGYQGIFKLLEGESRSAYFKTVAAFCLPDSEPVLFAGRLSGEITKRVYDKTADVMPYDRIFIPAGKKQTISGLTLAEKNAMSQRGEAFRRFGQYLKKASW
jgi:XTP/dITP diphosphohydrolase